MTVVLDASAVATDPATAHLAEALQHKGPLPPLPPGPLYGFNCRGDVVEQGRHPT